MRKLFQAAVPLALIVGALTGCPPDADRQANEPRGGRVVAGDPTDTTAERAGKQLALDWGTNLIGDKRNLAEGLVRTAWVQANLAANEWEQAGEDLTVAEDRIQDLVASTNVPKALRDKLAGLRTEVSTLGSQILNHDRAALKSAARLNEQLSSMMTDTTVVAWMGESATAGLPMGQGSPEAGRIAGAVAPEEVNGLRLRHRDQVWVPVDVGQAVDLPQGNVQWVGNDQGKALWSYAAPGGGGGGGWPTEPRRIYVQLHNGRYVPLQPETGTPTP